VILRLVRWELFKLARQRASYVGFVVCLGFVLVSLVGFRLSRWKNLRRYSDLGYDPLELINGPFFASYSLQIAFFAILPLLAATLAGNQLAGEARDGTLRAMLVRPPSRISVYLAKTIATWLWLQLIVCFLVALSLLVGSVALGGGDLLVFVWEFRKDGPWIVESPEWALLLISISVGAGVSLFVVAACALMLSAWTDAPVVAHVGTLGAFFTSVIIERLPEQLVGEELRELTPTAHMTFWHELFRLWDVVPSFDSARFWADLAWCMAFVVIFLAAGAWRFVRKDVTS
jgi:ABC-type transport system involved in multi-copper enzyme maturation permease subunit